LKVPAVTSYTIHARVRRGRYVHSFHAERERQEASITVAELEHALLGSEVIEEFRNDPRGVTYLVLGFAGHRPIHAWCTVQERPREIVLLAVM
jgi:hypothetical protein